MGRIDTIFANLRTANARGLMPFITGGHPNTETTTALLQGLKTAGACICEVGIPFSDPIADGPVIAGTMQQALVSGITVDNVIASVAAARSHTELGIVAMVSHSIVHRRGDADFVYTLADAGFDGLIVPDIDPHQASTLLPAIDERDLSFSLLISPTTPDARIAELCDSCRGFVYLLARAGITGTSSSLEGLSQRVTVLREATDLPIAVGFGIASPQAVAEAVEHCDAAIVGTALARAIGAATDPVEAGLRFVMDLAAGLQAPA